MPVDDTEENLAICMKYCGTCPSLPYPPEPMLFCARGRSPEKIVRKGCNCPDCLVYARYNLKDMYFCDFLLKTY